MVVLRTNSFWEREALSNTLLYRFYSITIDWSLAVYIVKLIVLFYVYSRVLLSRLVTYDSFIV